MHSAATTGRLAIMLMLIGIGQVSAAVAKPETALNAESPAEQNLVLLTGKQVIGESIRRHESTPYIYEEMVLIHIDHKQRRDVRRLHRYARLQNSGDFDGTLKLLYPLDVAGTTIRSHRSVDGELHHRLFLPALGARMVDYGGQSGNLLDSEFSLVDLMPEYMPACSYERLKDVDEQGETYFVVRATARADRKAELCPDRMLYLRQDSFFMVRIDMLDKGGHLQKRLNRQGIHWVGGEMWRASMLTMDNLLSHERSILKTEHIAYSGDFVPASVFSEAEIVAQANAEAFSEDSAQTDSGDESGSDSDNEALQPDAEEMPVAGGQP